MGNKIRSRFLLAAGFFVCLFAGSVYAQEIKLDASEACGDLLCYPSLDDANVFYYLPDQPRIAVKDGKPQFSFLKYARVQDGTEAGTGRAGGGGIVHFLVTYGASQSRVTKAEAALQKKHPDGKITGPVTYRKGSFALVTSFQESNTLHTKTLAVGKAPLMEGQKTAVSLALTPEGAEVLWESFRSATPDISLVFDMEFDGIREPYEATLEADWSQITKHDQVNAGFKYAWFGADVDVLFQELRQSGAVKITTKGESAMMDKILQSANAKLLTIMFDAATKDELGKLRAEKKYDNLNEAMKLMKANGKSASLNPLDMDDRQFAFQGPPRRSYIPEFIGSAYAENASEAKQNFDRAEQLFAAKNYREAAKYYELSIKASGDNAENNAIMLHDIGKCYWHLNENAKALDYFIRAEPGLVKNEHKALNYLAVAKIYIGQSKTDEATQAVDQGLAVASGSTKGALLYYRGMINKGKGNYAKASSDFQEAVAVLETSGKDSTEYAGSKRFAVETASQAYSSARKLDDLAAKSNWESEATQKALDAYLEYQDNVKPTGQREKDVDARVAFLGQKLEDAGVANVGVNDGNTTDTELLTVFNEAASDSGSTGNQTNAGQSTAAASKTPAKSSAKAKSSTKPKPKPKPKSKSKSTSKTKPKVRADKTPGFSLVASYKMRRIKRSGKLVYQMNHMSSETQSFVMTENIGDLYHRWGNDKGIFRAVTIDDPVFKQRDIAVTLDGQDIKSFSRYMNFVTVRLRKTHQAGDVTRDEVVITPELFSNSANHFMLRYGWHDDSDRDRWLNYEYQVTWSFHGGNQIESKWLPSNEAMLALAPPYRYRQITFEADGKDLQKAGVRHAVVTVNSDLQGKTVTRMETVKNTGEYPVAHLVVPQQGDKPPQVQITWYLKGGKTLAGDPHPLQGDIVYWDELPKGE